MCGNTAYRAMSHSELLYDMLIGTQETFLIINSENVWNSDTFMLWFYHHIFYLSLKNSIFSQ